MPLSLTMRIFVVYGVFVAMTAWFVLRIVNDQIKPAVRQSTEETLVDTANLLAELIGAEVRNGELPAASLKTILDRYNRRLPDAEIWGVRKSAVSHRIYITDQNGIVLFDSSGADVGEDYSQWNDVYLTLRGKYGARSSLEDPANPDSTVMHVAAPIKSGETIIGVLTVAKPNRTLEPYIERSERVLALYGGALLLLGIAVASVIAWRFGRTLGLMTRYAAAVSRGEPAEIPRPAGSDLRQLAEAIEHMRTQLEDKAYVERYVDNLTHELKSPLAAISGAAELLRGDLPEADRQRFINNIDTESRRLHELSERLLDLARIEQQNAPESPVPVDLGACVEELTGAQTNRFTRERLVIETAVPRGLIVSGESFLLRQAIDNLIDNAINWTPAGGTVRIGGQLNATTCELTVFNEGPSIPDYALPRLTERFYALPRPRTGRKSTGLGLSFVATVAALHGGAFNIGNTAEGVCATLSLPASSHTSHRRSTQEAHTHRAD